MKAIETEYNGVLFRSRLEARWAILFDALKVDYVYEPECFILENNQKYTPDFYLQKYDYYIEIKPNYDWIDNDYHIGRYRLFEKRLLILSGGFPNFNVNVDMSYEKDQYLAVVFCPNTKYEPIYVSGYRVGEEGEFKNDYLEEIEIVKKHRFWK